VIYTRDINKFVELHDRAGIANKNNADLFISVHCNAGHVDTYGSETYTMGLHKTEGNLEVAKRENAVVTHEKDYKKKYNGFDPASPMGYILMTNFQHAYIENSLKFAQKVEDNFKNNLNRKSRGVKQAGFLVLWKTSMPSCLIEIGYLTNTDDEKYLRSKDGQSGIASNICKALKQYKSEIESMN
jgi:N-acetylmuramoyl-L-alanine amidase